MSRYHAVSGSAAEDLFIDLFSETFGAEKTKYLYSQYHFYDIYQNSRYADFMLESGAHRIAIEIDDEASHNKSLVSSNKFYDDLLKQNSMIYLGWDVYRWAVRQMQIQPEAVKDELRVFLGSQPRFKEIEDYLPTQRGKELDGSHLELKQHQREALDALQAMRDNRETIALLYHATGTGKTVTAVMDAKRCGGRTLFLTHTQELVNQAADTFRNLWPEVTVGRYMEAIKEPEFFTFAGETRYDMEPTNKQKLVRNFNNKNKMIYENSPYYYEGILGGKTGYTSLAKNTLVEIARREDRTLIAVLMEAEGADSMVSCA